MNESNLTQAPPYSCPKCGFFSEQKFAYCPNCGTSTAALPPTTSASTLRVLFQLLLGLTALSMTGFSVVVSFIILVSGGAKDIAEWGLQIGVFPNLISAVCIGGIFLLNRLMR